MRAPRASLSALPGRRPPFSGRLRIHSLVNPTKASSPTARRTRAHDEDEPARCPTLPRCVMDLDCARSIILDPAGATSTAAAPPRHGRGAPESGWLRSSPQALDWLGRRRLALAPRTRRARLLQSPPLRRSLPLEASCRASPMSAEDGSKREGTADAGTSGAGLRRRASQLLRLRTAPPRLTWGRGSRNLVCNNKNFFMCNLYFFHKLSVTLSLSGRAGDPLPGASRSPYLLRILHSTHQTLKWSSDMFCLNSYGCVPQGAFQYHHGFGAWLGPSARLAQDDASHLSKRFESWDRARLVRTPHRGGPPPAQKRSSRGRWRPPRAPPRAEEPRAAAAGARARGVTASRAAARRLRRRLRGPSAPLRG